MTTVLVAVVLLLAAATGTLWDPLSGRALGQRTMYGLPALLDGDWWTVLAGAWFAAAPVQYVPVILGLALFGGFAEWRLGTWRAAVALVGTHLVAVLGAALLLAATRDHGYTWATTLSLVRDAGPSAGFLGAAAAATVTLTPPWRGRARAGLVAYVLLFVIHMGALADLEHVLGVGAGLVLGPVMVGRAPRFSWRPLTRRDFRLLACGYFVVTALEGLIQPFTSGTGPLASTLSEQPNAEFLVKAVQAAIWLWFARSLYKGRRRTWRWAVGLLVFVVIGQVIGVVAIVVMNEPGVARAVYEVAGDAFGLALLIVGRRAFRNPSPRRSRRTTGSLLAPADDEVREVATHLLQKEGTVNRLEWMTTWPENRWFLADPPSGYIAYRVHAGVALGLCDPVAATEPERGHLLETFADAVHAAGLVPCLFTVTEEAARHADGLGWHRLQVAEEAVVDLPTLSYSGKAWQDVRTALNQGAKRGMEFRLGPLGAQPRGVQMQVRAISAEWVEDKGLPEMGFTLGGVDEALDPNVRVGLAVDADSTVHGVTSWMPVYGAGAGRASGWTLDVMRRLPGGFRYSMEYLIASACLQFKEEGCDVVSLSGAPLARAAGVTEVGVDRGTLDAFLERLGATLEPYYGFRSLHAFKMKFQPRTEPLYLVFPDEAALPRIGLGLSRAYLPEAGVRELVTLSRSGRAVAH